MTEHALENALVSGLGFPEEPRWRDGALWFIDNWNKQVIGVREDGAEIGRLDLDFPPAASAGCRTANSSSWISRAAGSSPSTLLPSERVLMRISPSWPG